MTYYHPHRHLHSYVHNGRIGVLVEIGCETDFLARTEEFGIFVNNIALQIAAMAPIDVDALLKQSFVKDSSLSIGQLVSDARQKFRERVDVTRFVRWSTEEPEHPEHPTPPRTPAVIMSYRARS